MMAFQAGNASHEPPDGSSLQIQRSVTGTIKTGTGNSLFYSKFGITKHDTNQEESVEAVPEYRGSAGHSRKTSSSSTVSSKSIVIKRMSVLDDCGSKFPKLEDCAHFHYEFVELGHVKVSLSDDNQENLFGHAPSDSSPPQPHFHIQVTSRDKTWMIRRTYENLRNLDRQLHRCIFDRKFSLLPELRRNELTNGVQAMKKLLVLYLNRFSSIAGNMINCGPVLSWLELDNRGHRLIVSDDSAINTPAIGGAHVIKRYTAQAPDEISFEVGDMISIIDMPPGDESVWWRGKKGFEVGFFPADCVEMIGDKLPQAVTSKLPESKPVLRKRGKLISLLRNFFSSRPARTQLKRTGIVKERVFGCDLGEHLLNMERQIPEVLECCTHTIETHGIVDGIYRLSGVASNIQRLRNEFDEEKQPNLTDECYLQDIHSISSLMKAYFRDLPNPLFTFQLYDKFIAAIQDEENKLMKIHDVIQQLPPPHYRTAKYLMEHLSRVAEHGRETGMHCKNLAIVWAPNLLRSKDLEQACSTAALQGVGVQAIVTEYLISHADLIFSDQLQNLAASGATGHGSLRRGRPKSLALSTPTKLLSLEEARAIVNPTTSPKQKYIEVGGGPAGLPDKYHTVIDLPGKKKSRKDRKSPVSGWRGFFSKKGQGPKDRLPERSDSLESTSSVVIVTEDYDEDDGMVTQRLRPVRSADSLLTEQSRPGSRGRYSDISDSSTFINPYTDEFSTVRPMVTSLDRAKKGKATKRAISADNSYSEPEMEPILDMSPCTEGIADQEEDESSYNGLMSELETRLRGRSVSTSPKDIPKSHTTDGLGSLPVLNQTQVQGHTNMTRPRSQQMSMSLDLDHGHQGLMPKRSKSTALEQSDHSSYYDLPPVPPRHQGSKSHDAPILATVQPNKVKVVSPGKRKKAKAPLPPVIPTKKDNTDPKVESVSVTRKAHSIEDLVTLELSESPGARRKLLYSAPCELETQGLEGAPGEMAYETSFTDDEAFNTQNLSLTTDSENEVVERREALSLMEAGQDGLSLMEGVQDGLSQSEISGEEGGREAGVDRTQAIGQFSQSASKNSLNNEGEMFSGSDSSGLDAQGFGAGPSALDDSGLMSKSLSSVLTGAADTYYSSDEIGQQGAAAAGLTCNDFEDSNSDGHVSGATMSTNFSTSSDLPCATSTSDDSDFTSAQAYAESLRSGSAQLPQLRKSLVAYSTSDSDNSYSREAVTPRADAPSQSQFTFSASDTDTEIAKTPDEGDTATGRESSDRLTPNIDLSDSEVVFVDPHLPGSRDVYTSAERPVVLEGIQTDFNVTSSNGLESPVKSEPGLIVIRTPLQDSTEGSVLHAETTKIVLPKRQVASAPTTPFTEEALQDPGTRPTSEPQQPTKPGRGQYGDGYLADRSSSASPTFMEVKGNLVKKKTVFKDQDVEISVGMPDIQIVPETTHDATDAGSNVEQYPLFETANKDMKKSADSLLFDMEDLDSRDSFRSSMDKLNLSSEIDDVFYRPESMDNIRAETNMSISPDNYLDNQLRGPGEELSGESPSTESPSPNKSEATVPEYQVRSLAAMARKKSGKELSRKKSVKELMSRFESGESSDDTSRENLSKKESVQGSNIETEQDDRKSGTPHQLDIPVTEETSATGVSMSVSPAEDKLKTSSLPRKPAFTGIKNRIKSYQSQFVSSSDDSDPQRPGGSSGELTELVIVESSPPASSPSPVSLDPATARTSDPDEQSTSPKINDLRRRFEEQQRQKTERESRAKFRSLQTDSTSSFADSVTSIQSEPVANRAEIRAERVPIHQAQFKSSSEAINTKPSETRVISSDSGSEQSKDVPLMSPSSRSTLSERLHSLSERFKNYENDSEKNSSEENRSGSFQSSKQNKGQFMKRFSTSDKSEPLSVVGASGSGSETDSPALGQGAAPADSSHVTSLFERRKKFESFSVGDKAASEVTEVPKPQSSGVLPSSGTSKQAPADTFISKARQFGSKAVVVQTKGATFPKDSSKDATLWQDAGAEPSSSEVKQDIRAATLPRDINSRTASTRGSKGNARRKTPSTGEDERPVSVRDLSRQFERQLSEKSDSSRASTSSLRGTSWNCAHDVANGNTPVIPTSCDQGDPLANQNVSQQSWTTIL